MADQLSPEVQRDQLAEILREAVALYGKHGGPWNVPSDPGGWLERARAALELVPAQSSVFKPGQVWRIDYGKGNPNNRRVHIRALVDDQVVYCAWSRRHQGYFHQLGYLPIFERNVQEGIMKKVRA